VGLKCYGFCLKARIGGGRKKEESPREGGRQEDKRGSGGEKGEKKRKLQRDTYQSIDLFGLKHSLICSSSGLQHLVTTLSGASGGFGHRKKGERNVRQFLSGGVKKSELIFWSFKER